MRKVLEVYVNEEAAQYEVKSKFNSEQELADTIRVLVIELATKGMSAESLKKFIQQVYDHTDFHNVSEFTAN